MDQTADQQDWKAGGHLLIIGVQICPGFNFVKKKFAK